MHLKRRLTSSSAVVKTGEGEDFNREYNIYGLPTILSCPYIRTIRDVLEPEPHDKERDQTLSTKQPKCLILEWMDNDLRTVPLENFGADSKLPKVVAKSVLLALAFLKKDFDAVHTGMFSAFITSDMATHWQDINPNNVFLSDLTSSSPTVKIGDLGNGKKSSLYRARRC